jgi:hypothetical protein
MFDLEGRKGAEIPKDVREKAKAFLVQETS